MDEKKLLQLTEDDKLKIQSIAVKLVDKKYQYGIEVDLKAPPEHIEAFDCSELIEYLYYQIGLKIRDGSVYQYQASEQIEEKDVESQYIMYVFRDMDKLNPTGEMNGDSV